MTFLAFKNQVNESVGSLLSGIRSERIRLSGFSPYLYLVKEDGDSALRMWFLSHLIEDRYEANLSYPQWMQMLRDAK